MLNKKVLFTEAHKMAKTFEGDYRACFALALKILRRGQMISNVERRVNELNSQFNVNVKRWDSFAQECMDDNEDLSKFEALQETADNFRFKKEVYFVAFRSFKGQDMIKVLGSSFTIKEDLKALGFEYNKAPQSSWNLVV